MKLISLLIISLIVIVLSLSACSKQVPAGKFDNLSKCLTEKGAVMYGTEWCTHCQNQKKAFGDSFQYITFVDCDANSQVCKDAGVEGYPTWVINGNSYAGEQNFYDLAKSAGCLDRLN